MSITTAVCDSYTQEVMSGVHLSTDTYKIALIKPASAGTIGAATANYSALGTDEVAAGLGYTATGIALSGFNTSLATGVASLDFADATWALASFSAAGALIYNSTQGGKAVCVLNFGGTYVGGGGNFTVPIANVVQAT
jgi:hypothetical protein